MNEQELSNLPDDTLWTMLKESDAGEKVEVASVLSKRLADRQDFTSAIAVSESMVAASNEIADELWAAEAHYRMGFCNFRLNRYEESIASYQQALPLWVNNGRDESAARTAFGISDVLMRLKRYSEALEMSNTLIQLAETAEDDSCAGDGYFFKGKALYWLDQESDALTALFKARELLRSCGNVLSVRNIDDFTATVYLYLGKQIEAAELLRSCLTVSKEQKNTSAISYAANRLGNVLVRLGESKEAISHLEYARELASENENFFRIAESEFDMSYAYEQLRDFPKSLECAYQARAMYDYSGNDQGVVRCDIQLADLYWQMREYEKAITANRKVISHAENWGGWEREEFLARTGIAENYFELRDYDNCISTLNEPQSDEEFKEPAIGVVARLYLKARIAADQDRITEAKALAEEAIALTEPHLVNSRTPYLFEIKAEALTQASHEDADQIMSQAVAMHLAYGNDDHARELSKRFMPEIKAVSKDKSEPNRAVEAEQLEHTEDQMDAGSENN